MIAHKFGGSSVANAERIGKVLDILLARAERQVVVVSAMQGVTDTLIGPGGAVTATNALQLTAGVF